MCNSFLDAQGSVEYHFRLITLEPQSIFGSTFAYFFFYFNIVFLDALKLEPLLVEPLNTPGHKKQPQNHKPTRQVLVIAKEHGHKQKLLHFSLLVGG